MTKLLFASLLLLGASARAESLTAPRLAQILGEVERATFKARGHALLFGHDSIESCAYEAEGILVLDNYCFPAKNYPARALTIWSKALGEVELYDQDLGGGKLWHDVRINQFPERVQRMFSFDLSTAGFDVINTVIKKFDELQNPGCWSTSIDLNTNRPAAGCYRADIRDFPAYERETQALVLDRRAWDAYYGRILARVKGN